MLNRFFNLIRNLFIKDEVKSQSGSVYDEEIKNREQNLKLFYGVVGENPLKQIDWIIENGFEKFNELFRSYEDGSIGRVKREQIVPSQDSVEAILCRSTINGTLIYVSKLTGKEFNWDSHESTCKMPLREIEYLVKNSRIAEYIEPVNKEIFDYRLRTLAYEANDEALRQSLSARDYLLYSPANQMKKEEDATFDESSEWTQVVELRGGIGNKVIARYKESSPYGDMFS